MDAAGGSDTVTLLASNDTIQVNGANAATTFGIAFTNIEALDAAGGSDTVLLTGSDDTFTITSNNTGLGRGITFTNIENVDGKDGDDTLTNSTGQVFAAETASVAGVTVSDFKTINTPRLSLTNGPDRFKVEGPDTGIGQFESGTITFTELVTIDALDGNDEIIVDLWTGSGTIIGGGGTDRIVKRADVNTRLTDTFIISTSTSGKDSSTAQMSLSLEQIESAHLAGYAGGNTFAAIGASVANGPSGANRLDAGPSSPGDTAPSLVFTGELLLEGGFGADRLYAGIGVNKIYGHSKSNIAGTPNSGEKRSDDWFFVSDASTTGDQTDLYPTEGRVSVRSAKVQIKRSIVDFSLSGAAVNVTLLDRVPDRVAGARLLNNIIIHDVFNLLVGSGFNDTLIGNNRVLGTTTAPGTDGRNVIFGGGGDDFIRGRGGRNYLVGGEGNDNIDLRADKAFPAGLSVKPKNSIRDLKSPFKDEPRLNLTPPIVMPTPLMPSLLSDPFTVSGVMAPLSTSLVPTALHIPSILLAN